MLTRNMKLASKPLPTPNGTVTLKQRTPCKNRGRIYTHENKKFYFFNPSFQAAMLLVPKVISSMLKLLAGIRIAAITGERVPEAAK